MSEVSRIASDHGSAFAILDARALTHASLNTEPYDFIFAPDAIRSDARSMLLADVPVVSGSGSIPLSKLSYGRGFQALIDDLESAAFREIVEQKFNLDLTSRVTTISVRGRLRRSSDGYIHTDLADKVISVLLYLNRDWREAGGALRVLRSRDINDYAIEIPPVLGNMLIFRRSDRSWHGHLPYEGSRLSVQFNWVTSRRRSRQFWRHKFNFLNSLLPSRS